MYHHQGGRDKEGKWEEGNGRERERNGGRKKKETQPLQKP